jgi:hypothetical protein
MSDKIRKPKPDSLIAAQFSHPEHPSILAIPIQTGINGFSNASARSGHFLKISAK